MKHSITVEMITGTSYQSTPLEVENFLLKVFYDLDSAAYVQLPIAEGDCVILNPKHIVGILLKEVK